MCKFVLIAMHKKCKMMFKMIFLKHLLFFTLKTVLITSLFWIFVLVIAMIFYSEILLQRFRTIILNNEENIVAKIVQNQMLFQKTYRNPNFKQWEAAPVVPPNVGLPGEMGVGVSLPKNLGKLAAKKLKGNNINVLVSDLIAVNRSLKDFRKDECKSVVYPEFLPATTVVIVFYNEPWSTLIRTIWSVINRSPRNLLEEIILVDDASDRAYLKGKLDNYIKLLPVPVRMLRSKDRIGLTRAKVMGAKEVRSEVITFLDAHCECTEGWLEPLLARVALNRKAVACPVIDNTSLVNFKQETDPYFTILSWVGFDWALSFHWSYPPPSEMARRGDSSIAPIRTPMMVGGLFSINREVFFEMGAYDEGMQIWGGENIEMSVRIWTCGGILEMVPCSHVGHVYRLAPYPIDPMYNYFRTIDVWFDEWAMFVQIVAGVPKYEKTNGLAERKKLRKDLKCKSFQWYLEKVFVDSDFPIRYYYLGTIRSVGVNKCLDIGDNPFDFILYNCHGLGGNQVFLYTITRELISNGYCLDAFIQKDRFANYYNPCGRMGGNQEWYYNRTSLTLRNPRMNLCLSVAYPKNLANLKLTTTQCNESSKDQQWLFDDPLQWKSPLHTEDFLNYEEDFIKSKKNM